MLLALGSRASFEVQGEIQWRISMPRFQQTLLKQNNSTTIQKLKYINILNYLGANVVRIQFQSKLRGQG